MLGFLPYSFADLMCCRARSVSRSISRGTSLQDPLSDAQALEAAHRAAASQSTPAQGTQGQQQAAAVAAEQQPESLSNEAMVWEMLYVGDNYALPVADAEASWRRAMGQEVAAEQEVCSWLIAVTQHECECSCASGAVDSRSVTPGQQLYAQGAGFAAY
jgi:hypothetical protein